MSSLSCKSAKLRSVLSQLVQARAKSSTADLKGLWQISGTRGAEGYPAINARYIPEYRAELARPNMDTSSGVPSLKHWQSAEWSEDELRQASKDHVLLSWSGSQPVEELPFIDHGVGVHLVDNQGKKYLDWTSQAMCTNLGYTVPETVRRAVDRQLDRLPYMYGGLGLHPIRVKLAKLLAELTPGDINGFLFPSGGSEANEAAIRIARLYTGKHKILTQYRSYHGSSSSSMAATGDFRRAFAEVGASGFVKIFNPQPHMFSWGSTDESATQRILSCLEDQINAEGPDSIAAIMLESIVGAGGVLVPPVGYMEGVRALCDKYGILLICDEVMVGFGRTGKFFGFQHFEGVLPDIVTSAKGLTASYLPLAMVGLRQKIKDHFWKNPIGWGATYHAHPVSVACAYETIKYMVDQDILGHVQRLQPLFFDEMQKTISAHPCIRQGRAVGLFGCFDLVNPDGFLVQKLGAPSPPEVLALKRALRENGLFCLFRPPHLHAAPPLVISESELVDGFRRLNASLDTLDREQRRAKLNGNQSIMDSLKQEGFFPGSFLPSAGQRSGATMMMKGAEE